MTKRFAASARWGGAAAALALAGCAATPHPSGRDVAERIGADAAAFNVAYSKAVNGQILLNILRSRDRQPRYYLAMSGITDTAGFLYGDNVGLGGVALGEQRGQPFAIGSLGARRESTSKPTYSVSPLDAKTLKAAVFQPTPTSAFAHYWESGWPRDLLVLLMVERMTITRGDGQVAIYTNEANDLVANCPPESSSRGCAFYAAAEDMLAAVAAARESAPSAAASRAACGLVAVYGETPWRLAPPPRDSECAPALAVGDRLYRLDLRSFDDIIYYVGELLRPSFTAAEGRPAGPMDALIGVRTAGLRGGGQTPLFRVYPASVKPAGVAFAAELEYEGETYYAGPAVGRACPAPAPGVCADDALRGDRSSSVLSLLAELLALNQSPEAIRAPARLFTE